MVFDKNYCIVMYTRYICVLDLSNDLK